VTSGASTGAAAAILSVRFDYMDLHGPLTPLSVDGLDKVAQAFAGPQ